MRENRDGAAQPAARATLRRWAASARSAMWTGVAWQLLALAGWLLLAVGMGRAVEAAATGDAAGPALMLAAAGLLIRGLGLARAEATLAIAGMAIVNSARADLLGAAREAGAGWLGGAPTGARVSQLVDRTERLAGYCARWLPGMRMAVIGPLLVLAAVAIHSWLSAVLLLVSVLVLPLLLWLTAGEAAARARAEQASLDALAGAFQARMAQSGLIRAFRAVGREGATLATAAQALRERTMSILRAAFLSTAVLEFFASISIALVAVYVGFQLLGVFPIATGETVTLAEGLTALMLAPEFFAPIRRLAGLHHDRSDAQEAARHLHHWLAQRQERAMVVRRPRLYRPPTIAFEAVSLSWNDQQVAVEQVTFSVDEGETVALCGPSGSGKTSILLALLGRLHRLEGHITVNGEPMSARESLADSVAYIGQTPWLLDASLRTNLTLARPDATVAELDHAAHSAGLDTITAARQQGLDWIPGRAGAGLSGGERQRIALARAVLRRAPLWLLDEPTAHLDPEAEQDFIRRLRELSPAPTILMATHSPILAAAADRAVDLRHLAVTSA